MLIISAAARHLQSLAIIAPPAEVQWLSDYVVAREMPRRVAAVIAIVALFAIAWTLLSESPSKHPSASSVGAGR